MNGLKGKKILVTAGSTWVPIDKVRVITNVFSGNLGIKIAKKMSEEGAQVTLLIGSGRAILPKTSKKLNIISYKYFDDLLDLVKKELPLGYDIMIHSAAVSDYEPVSIYDGKVKSSKKSYTIKFKPTIKIVDLVKKISPKIFLVKFKLEVGTTKDKLIDIAFKSMRDSNADLIVANEFSETKKDHRAYIIDNSKKIIVCNGKDNIAEKLTRIILSK
jgi:phosphopantothenoylcysteine decarboxylase / phosphopantothenate---cysteine ligase